MHKRLTAAVVLLATIVVASPASASVLDGHRQLRERKPLPCDIKIRAVPQDGDRLIACVADRQDYPAWIPLCIGDHESGDNPTAASGENLGILQYHRSTFAQHWSAVKSWARLRPGQHPGPFCARCAVIAGVWWMKHRGVYPWSTAAGCGA